jgi:hypothetical protein
MAGWLATLLRLGTGARRRAEKTLLSGGFVVNSVP